ncbi:MAG: sugar phosphate isomerase/epimerase [Clostridiales bacterium]|nr:sugar phosphate isomerase/epimerase [Clostridiales bacterium]
MKIELCAFADEAGSALSDQIAALKAHDIRLLELRSADGQNVADLSEEKARDIKKRLDENGITVFSIGSPIGKIRVSDDFSAHLDKLNHIFALCGIFGCQKIRMFSFFTETPARDRAEVMRRLSVMAAAADRRGLALYHENEKEIYGDTVARTVDLLDAVPALRSIYDPANFMQCGEDADLSIDTLLSRADYIHIKDVVRATGELVPAGYGDCKIDRILSLLNGGKVLTVEPHLALFDGYAAIDGSEMKTRFAFKTQQEAFAAAVTALKDLLRAGGFIERDGAYVKEGARV